MTNTLELEVAIKRSGLAKKKIAQHLNLSTMGLYKKINNMSEFKAGEIVKISNLLKLDILERDAIFFARDGDFKSHNTA